MKPGRSSTPGIRCWQLPEKDGKIDPADLQEYLQNFEADANHDHMVFPGMVYLSHPTEYGTLYSRKELQRSRRSAVRMKSRSI